MPFKKIGAQGGFRPQWTANQPPAQPGGAVTTGLQGQ